MLGSLLVGTGIVTIGGAAISEYIQSKKKSTIKETTDNTVEYNDRTPSYTQLFENLSIMKTEKGDWIKCLELVTKKNYRLVKFKISDTLSYLDFVRVQDKLEEKMLTDYAGDSFKNKITVYMDKGLMYFRILNEKIDLVPYEFKKTKSHLIAIGTTIDDEVVYWNLCKDSHMKIIGATNSGKSRQMQIIITHIFNNISGAKLWLMDFKFGAELGIYQNCKNVIEYTEDIQKAKYVLNSFKEEYKNRMKTITEANCRNFDEYIEKHPRSNMKRSFLIIDEFSFLMELNQKATNKTEGYNAINELVDLAKVVRAAGLHMIIATQRPTIENIPSNMKSNLTGTIGMSTENELNSKLIIDQNGCESLETSHSICRLESKIVHMRSFYIEDSVMNETVKKFARPQEETKKK